LQHKKITLIIATVLLTVAMFFCGCSSAPKQIGPKLTEQWAYAPNSIHIHPLSRIRVTESEDTAIVVHVSLLDGDGFACRGNGILSVKATTPSGGFLVEKIVDLQEEATNREHFDQVTRTYRVQFESIPSDIKRAQLHASFAVAGDAILKSKTVTLINHNKDN
jgi:hypothetical protein